MAVIHALLQWSWLLPARLVVIGLGLPVVALALPFRVETRSVSDGRLIVNLPRWAWLWGNDHDGLRRRALALAVDQYSG